MRSATIFASVLAFAASALAQTSGYAVISAPADGEVVPAGKTYTIKWSAGSFSGPATISLLGGASASTLQILNSLATSVEVGKESFAWPVDCSLGEDKTYGIKIADEASNGATFQYSFPFAIKGPACSSTSSTSSAITVSATVSATTSATGYSVTGYPTLESSSTVSTSSSIKNTTSTAISYSASTSVSVATTTKKSTTAVVTPTTLATSSTPVVTVTQGATTTVGSSSSTPATSTTASPTVPTAGATRAGAGLALGLLAAALAL